MPEVIKGSWPFLVAMVIGTLMVIFIPQLATWLPSLM